MNIKTLEKKVTSLSAQAQKLIELNTKSDKVLAVAMDTIVHERAVLADETARAIDLKNKLEGITN